LVAHLNPSTGRKPNIFIFVIDSLRRDYVSPYNSAVTFTPALEALAEDKDTVVFQNAFTRYGGTGLSEPSIWVGGMMLHQQYVSPFAPLNSLQKLLDANHYAEWISKDNILQQIVPPSPNINELDANIGAMHYDLCQTLRELTQRLQFASPSAGPIFVYTQPQNIHVSVIDREGRSVPDGARLPAQFDAAYASRVQKLDACLGEFLTGLKKNGLYDNSLIIVTSDHGDSLGEHGRWGHAYTLFPEIVRIPLIVHLPPWMLHTLKYDPKSVAFLTDLTPSLYYLLGQKAVANNPLFGRPLFTDSLDEQQPYSRDSYLLASSYAPVYGLLSNSGRSLYIADGVNYRDYAYQLNPDGSSREAPLTDAERSAAQDEIRRQINAIARFYHLQ
jgi:arylsulfatase A-like enzyme